ncbi:MAG: arylesterase [Mucilaginibacter sp.]|nr:arylesterase [Mucilaginibacter sp.]
MEIPAFIHSPVAASFREVYRTLASANQLSLVPFFLDGVAAKPHLNLPDRLHPNAEGYKVIADNVWPVIKKLLV